MAGRGHTVNAFLSHGYGAVEVNLFFRELISTVADVAFRVDRGKAATSTTRLERMIRDAQLFIGVWPVPTSPGARSGREELLHASRYFRLELDIAIRARKPGIIFSDQRYGNVLRVPSTITHVRYDAQEIHHGRASAHWSRLQKLVDSFFRDSNLSFDSGTADPAGPVGLLLPDHTDLDVSTIVRDLVAGIDRDAVDIRVPLDEAGRSMIQAVDWVICPVGHPEIDPLRAFLYGQCVPVLRLHDAVHGGTGAALEDALFGYLDVGYRKDITKWRTEEDLRQGLRERLEVIVEEPRLIGNTQEAVDYFTLAAKRKSNVFLSYAGEDRQVGAAFSVELNRIFQSVFDYRDNRSLRIGEFWQDQVSNKLERAVVGVILLSADYVRSDYCMDEARRLHDGLMRKRVKLLPVKLDSVPTPPVLSGLQYARLQDSSAADIITQFLESANPE
jgi:hypothetical protein